MGTIQEKLAYTKKEISNIYDVLYNKGYKDIKWGGTPLAKAAQYIELNSNICNTAGANATAEHIENGYTAYVKGKEITGTMNATKNLVNSITFTGSYATSTYYNRTNSGCSINPDTGHCIIYIQGGTSTAYESIRFNNGGIPCGATWVSQSYYSNASMSTEYMYTVLITNITYPVDVVCNFTNTNSSYDYSNVQVTITKA